MVQFMGIEHKEASRIQSKYVDINISDFGLVVVFPSIHFSWCLDSKSLNKIIHFLLII